MSGSGPRSPSSSASTQASRSAWFTSKYSGSRAGRQSRGELSTLDEWSRLYGERGDGPAALRTALRAHHLAVIVRDRKAQAQTAATVALAYLTLGDATTAIEWIEDCLTIARDSYPYLAVEGLLALATARRATGDEAAAISAAKQASSVAASCGFRLLEAQAARHLSR